MFDVGMTNDEALLLPLVNDRQYAVVRSDKILILCADQQRPALGSHARVDSHDVDCCWRKVGVGGGNRQRTVEQVERRDIVRDVHDGYIGIDLQDYAFQRSDKMVVRSVVSCECDDRVGQWILSPRISCALRGCGERQRSAFFDATGGALLGQEFVSRLLCNRQWANRQRSPVRTSPHPVRARKDASPGQENGPGNTIDHNVRNTVERCGHTAHPRAKLPDRVVPWVLRLLRSSHPPRHERQCSREETVSGGVPRRQLCSRRCRQYPPVQRRLLPYYELCLLRRGSSHRRIVPFLD